MDRLYGREVGGTAKSMKEVKKESGRGCERLKTLEREDHLSVHFRQTLCEYCAKITPSPQTDH
ncbi:hypothetical protein PHLCEN_2v479 [Hermanssonia centrifuga]|uniref:Uncharacterized protein n=1 Tax=Hermanssonia centrifuga TaxID=98765 RepID=A0A2R6S5X4_9APHY|nr:hypothetical protein PHLCEN_2v479 [Hermanssonia centrifuga]